MKILVAIIIFLTPFSLLGQTSIEGQIEEIRARFYGLSDVKLTKLAIEKYEYFFQNDKIKKVTLKTDSSIHEYYYDLDYISNHAYFVYTTNLNHGRKENRYYFGKEETLIRWLGPDKNPVDLKAEENCAKRLNLIANAKDLLIIYNNYLSNRKHPDYNIKVQEIDKQIEVLSSEVLEPDTVEIDNVPDEYYYSHKVEFRDKNQTKVKFLSFTGGDHGSETTTSFYSGNGQLIYEIRKGGDVFGHSGITHTYYNEGKLFRIITFSSVIGDWNNCRQFQHEHVAELDDY